MRICIVGKYPPIQGGVSSHVYWAAQELRREGHTVWVVTNADLVEWEFRAFLTSADEAVLRGGEDAAFVRNIDRLPYGSYVPWAAPFVTQLQGLAIQTVQQFACELIIGWYFEPYGIAAASAAQYTGCSLAILHAGTDLGKLAKRSDFSYAYRAMLSQAVVVGTDRTAADQLVGLGVAPERIVLPAIRRLPVHPVRAIDNDGNERTGLAERISEWLKDCPFARTLVSQLRGLGMQPAAAPGVCRIAILGKVSIAKGSFDLLTALRVLVGADVDFEFVVSATGVAETLERFYEELLSCAPLVNRTRLVPPMPPWRVPSFLASVDVVCCLERKFPVAFHQQTTLREVLAARRCAVVSRDILTKHVFRDNLLDGVNVVVVEDPEDHEELARKLRTVLAAPETRAAIAARGGVISTICESWLAPGHPVLDVVSAFQKLS